MEQAGTKQEAGLKYVRKQVGTHCTTNRENLRPATLSTEAESKLHESYA